MAKQHRATITITGAADADDVSIGIDFDPPLDRKNVSAVAYLATVGLAAMREAADAFALAEARVEDGAAPAAKAAGGAG